MSAARQQILASFLELVPRLHAEVLSERDGFRMNGSPKSVAFDIDCRQIIAACEGLAQTCVAAQRVMGNKT